VPVGLHNPFWITPVAAGSLLVIIGILIFSKPELLAYFVAGVFMAAGIALIGFGVRMRGRVTYHRIDPNREDDVMFP
jgi:uncharacterized membrane protein HdeD (DUF308 family)